MLDKIARYYNTVKYLRPVQLAGQLRKSHVLRSIPTFTSPSHSPRKRPVTLIPALDMDEVYLARFNTDRLMHGELTLLNETHPLDLSTWHVEASPLWRFNLHYFEYTIPLGAQYHKTGDSACYLKFKELVTSWKNANPIGRGDGWHPYTISMRLPNWFICFDLFGKAFEEDTAFQDMVYHCIYAQYRVLLKRQELWQLGNHYFENLKTILLCSLIFGEQKIFDKHIRLFLSEVNEEVLPDGVHFELSPMYHKVIMEDILRVTYWLRQTKTPQWKQLVPELQKMANASVSLEKGMGKTPLFNDSGGGIAKENAALLQAANELFGIEPVVSDLFPAGGYYKLYDGAIALMLDAGTIGPSYMAGHGHCDCLSFELSVDGKPLFVNSGTYQYQGEHRSYFRSTRAHNTLTIGDREQSECWGEHRVARRIINVKAEKNGQLLAGSYRSYSGDTHTRMLSLADGALTVLDSVKTVCNNSVRSYLHIADGYQVITDGAKVTVIADGIEICKITPIEARFSIHDSGCLAAYAPEFGVLHQSCCIEFSWLADEKQHGYIIQIY